MYSSRYILTYSMEQSPSWEAYWFFSWSRNSPHFWNPKVHHRTHKCPPPVPILSRLYPVHTPTSYFLKIHIIFLPSMPGSPKWSLALTFPHQNHVYASPSPICATCLVHLILLNFITRKILGEQYRSFSSLLCGFLRSCYLDPPRPKYSPQHPIPKHPQPAFLPQCERPVLHPYKTTGRIIVLLS